MDSLSVTCSRQISAITFISALCQHAEAAAQYRSLVLEKGIMRLVRFWITTSTLPFDEMHPLHRKTCYSVVTVSFGELRALHERGIFSHRSIHNFDTSFITGLISEIVSRCSLLNGKDQESEYSVLIQFIQTFLMNSPTDKTLLAHDDHDKLFANLSSFDNALPTILAGLVLEQDYDSLCAYTGFRLYLLSELKRLERKYKNDTVLERVLGKTQPKKRHAYGSKSGEDLKRRAANLCIANDADLNVLGQILKCLLLESDKSPLVFFLKTVVDSKVSFGVLLKKSEFTVLEELVWELGKCEEEPPANDFVERSWESFYRHQNAFQALKRGALWLQRANEQVEKANENTSADTLNFSLDAQDFANAESVKTDALVEQWIRKHYMRLLVNVTTKWKRGRIDTKIAAMKSLRVLLRFLCPADSAQYITQVLGIVDGCMNLQENSSVQRDALSRLRFLAVKTLSHFTRILLSRHQDCWRESLQYHCQSLSPL